MGIRPGSVLTVQSFSKTGPLVIRLDGSRVALGRGLAERILVRPVPETPPVHETPETA